MSVNRMAALIAGVWAVGQLCFMANVWTPLLDAGLDCGALAIGMVLASRSRNRADLLTGLLFAPMLAVHAGAFGGHLHPYYAWWAIHDLAFLQIGTMLAGNDWGKGRRIIGDLLGTMTRRAAA